MRSENLRGIVLMLLAMGTLALMDATMKDLVGRYSPLQVAALRGLVSLPFVAASLALNRYYAAFARLRGHYRTVEIVSGAFLIAIGLWVL